MRDPSAIVAIGKADTHPVVWSQSSQSTDQKAANFPCYQPIFDIVSKAFKVWDIKLVSSNSNAGVYALRDWGVIGSGEWRWGKM